MEEKIKLEIELDKEIFDMLEEHAMDQHGMTFKNYMEDFLKSYAEVIKNGNINIKTQNKHKQ